MYIHVHVLYGIQSSVFKLEKKQCVTSLCEYIICMTIVCALYAARGRARLLVEPARHNQQYSDHFPFATKNDIYEIEFNRYVF